MAIGTPARVSGPHSNYAVTTSSFTTGSFTPTAGRLLIAVTSSESPAGTLETGSGDSIAISQTHAGSWSWTSLYQFYVANSSQWWEQITLHYAIVPNSPGAGTITFTYNDGSAPEDEQRVIFITNIYDIAGIDTVTPVIQSKTGQTTGSSQTLTLNSTPATSSVVFGVIGDSFIGTGYTNIAPPTGYTELNEDRADNSGAINLETCYKAGSAGTSLNWTNVSGGFGSGAIAIEIAEASTGSTILKTAGNHMAGGGF